MVARMIVGLLGPIPSLEELLAKQISQLPALSATFRGARTEVSPEVAVEGAWTKFPHLGMSWCGLEGSQTVMQPCCLSQSPAFEMIMCHGRLRGFGFDAISSWVTIGIDTPKNMARWRLWWMKGAHAKGNVHQCTNEWCMQRDVLTNGWSHKDMFVDGWMRKHARSAHEWTNGRTCTFREKMSMSSLPTCKQGATHLSIIKRTKYHQRICTLCHAEVKLWYTMKISIT